MLAILSEVAVGDGSGKFDENEDCIDGPRKNRI